MSCSIKVWIYIYVEAEKEHLTGSPIGSFLLSLLKTSTENASFRIAVAAAEYPAPTAEPLEEEEARLRRMKKRRSSRSSSQSP